MPGRSRGRPRLIRRTGRQARGSKQELQLAAGQKAGGIFVGESSSPSHPAKEAIAAFQAGFADLLRGTAATAQLELFKMV